MESGVTESGYSVNVVHDSRTVNQDTIDVIDAIDCLYVPLRYGAVTVQVTLIYISVHIGTPPIFRKDYCIFLIAAVLGALMRLDV